MKKFFVILTVILLFFSFTSCKEPEPKPKSFDSKGLWQTIAKAPDGSSMKFYLDINNDAHPNSVILIVDDPPENKIEERDGQLILNIGRADKFETQKSINADGVVSIDMGEGLKIVYWFVDENNIEGNAVSMPFTSTRVKNYTLEYTTPPGSESGE